MARQSQIRLRNQEYGPGTSTTLATRAAERRDRPSWTDAAALGVLLIGVGD
jgi:hypothetical protein